MALEALGESEPTKAGADDENGLRTSESPYFETEFGKKALVWQVLHN